MRPALALALLTASLLFSGGCATLFAPSADVVHITSAPEGAQVLLDGYPVGQTPLSLRVDRNTFSDHFVTLRARGHRSLRFMLLKSLEGVAILNLSSLLSWGIDALSGNMMAYDPRSYFFDLPPEVGALRRSERQRDQLRFALVNQRNLLRDISRREGDFLWGFLALYGIDRGDATAAAIQLAAAMPSLVAAAGDPPRVFERLDAVLCRDAVAPAPRCG